MASFVHERPQECRRHFPELLVPGAGVNHGIVAELDVKKAGCPLPMWRDIVEHDAEERALARTDQQPKPPTLIGWRIPKRREGRLEFRGSQLGIVRNVGLADS